MNITDEGLELIRRFEGFRDTAYLCPGGKWTVGYGHTSDAGQPMVERGTSLSREQAEQVLRTDVERFAAGVRKNIRKPLGDQQFSALVSFAYNVGLSAFRSSSVLKAVNAGAFDTVPRRLQLWVKAQGRVLPGLVKRRAAEAALFMGGSAEQGAGAEQGVPDIVAGKPVLKSTTVASAVIGALASLLSGGIGLLPGAGQVGLLLALVALGAAVWIIRERLMKSREEGI